MSKDRHFCSSRQSGASNDGEHLRMRESAHGDTAAFTSSPVPGRLGRGSRLSRNQRHASVGTANEPDFTLSSPRRLRIKLPEFEIGLLLIEVYFSRVWTSSLLFDYRSIVEDYRAAVVPEHILLSIFAVASL